MQGFLCRRYRRTSLLFREIKLYWFWLWRQNVVFNLHHFPIFINYFFYFQNCDFLRSRTIVFRAICVFLQAVNSIKSRQKRLFACCVSMLCLWVSSVDVCAEVRRRRAQKRRKRRGNIVREEAGGGFSDSSFRFMSLTSCRCQAQPAVPFLTASTSASSLDFFSVTDPHGRAWTSLRLWAELLKGCQTLCLAAKCEFRHKWRVEFKVETDEEGLHSVDRRCLHATRWHTKDKERHVRYGERCRKAFRVAQFCRDKREFFFCFFPYCRDSLCDNDPVSPCGDGGTTWWLMLQQDTLKFSVWGISRLGFFFLLLYQFTFACVLFVIKSRICSKYLYTYWLNNSAWCIERIHFLHLKSSERSMWTFSVIFPSFCRPAALVSTQLWNPAPVQTATSPLMCNDH